MNRNFSVYTVPNECQDCYKCVRHCPCKAIQIENARAAVIPELCVSCGECVRVCPAHAKKIRSDLDRVRLMVQSGEKIFASVAPSYVGYFKNADLEMLGGVLKQLGFAGYSETALGAQIVSAQTGEFLKNAPPGVYISSACPATVDYITKYHPEWRDSITPIISPVMAHARLLHQLYGNEVKVVFIGPCAAKKNEADRHPEDLALAMTFAALEDWMGSKNIELKPEERLAPMPSAAEEGRAYSLEGGMNDTLRENTSGTRYLSVSGIADLNRVLSGVDQEQLKASGGKIFIEALACRGGCVNGPVMPPAGTSSADVLMKTLLNGKNRSSLGREIPVDVKSEFPSAPVPEHTVTQEALTAALASVGKYTLADELNCGGCGYNTCREFAKAKLEGKAEASMCLSYLRKIARRTSTALIKYIPAGVVIVDDKLQVLECNRHFAELCGDDAIAVFDSCGSLNGAFLASLVEYTDLFESVMAHSGELERFNQVYGDRILNISVFSITPGETAGAVIQDVTRNELRREQVAEKAREVIRKNVLTVQKIASYLGEHMADTEILLNEVAGAYEHDRKNSGEKKA